MLTAQAHQFHRKGTQDLAYPKRRSRPGHTEGCGTAVLPKPVIAAILSGHIISLTGGGPRDRSYRVVLSINNDAETYSATANA